MKTYIDFFETFKTEMIGTKQFRNKFVRRWGTETLDGVPVLKERFTVYPGHTSSNSIQNMCKMLGIWSDVKEADFSTIAGYYLYLNPSKDTSSQEELNAELMAEKIDAFCPVGEWQYATINYVDKADPSKFTGWTKDDILDYIDNDYRNIFSANNGFVVGDTLAETAMGKYVLFDDGSEFEVVTVDSAVVPRIIESIDYPVLRYSRTGAKKYYAGLSVSIKYKRIVNDIDPEGALVTAILVEQDEYQLKVLNELQNSTPDYNGGGVFGQEALVTNEIWYKSQLRLSAIKAPGIRTKDLIGPVLATLDTGQIKKKVKWYKKVLGFVLIVIAIVLAAPSGGASWSLATLGLYLTIAIALMIVIQLQWAKTNAAAAEYMGRWVKIAGFISLAVGIAAIVQNLGRMATQEAVKQSLMEGGKMTAEEAAKAAAMMSAKELASYGAKAGIQTGLMAGTSNLTVSSAIEFTKNYLTKNLFSIGMKMLKFGIKMRQSEMSNDLEDRRQYSNELAEQLTEADDRNLNVSLEDMKVYAEPLSTIKSRCDYNFPYEKEMARIHIGNIQRSSYAKIGLNEISKDLA